MIKRKKSFILIIIFFIGLFICGHDNVHAAEVGKVNYCTNGGVRIFKGKSLLSTDKCLKNETRWKIFGTYERLNILYYDLGGQQYIPVRYLDKVLENSIQELNSIGQIKYRVGYRVISWTSPNIDRRIYSGKGYFNGQKVAIKKRVVNAGHVWYQLINEEWLDGQYITLISEKVRKEKVFSRVTAEFRPKSIKNSSFTAPTSDSIENIVLVLVNNYRNKNGLNGLKLHHGLQLGSKARVNEEIIAINQSGNNNSVDHLCLNGTEFSTEPNIRSFGIGEYGENLAVVNSQKSTVALANHFFNLWINSPGHKANILNKRFTATGITVAKLANGQYIGMQEFAGR